MLVRVLLILDDAESERRLDRIFEPLAAAVATAPQDAVLWDRVSAFPADLVVIGRSSLPDSIEQTVEAIQALPERPEVIVVSADENAVERARLLIAGCTAVLNLALDDTTLHEAFNAFVTRHRRTSIERLQHQLDAPQAMLTDFESTSPTMQTFLRIVHRVVEPDTSLLIQGETGVGKERLARAIHAASPRSTGPFIPVILAAFPDTLVEAELFGYEKGAFTGAVGARRGCFELAHGGTIFLDEIGDLPQHLQVKLLRVLQERVIKRLGSEQSIDVDVRVVAATNRDLRDDAATGAFRRDLYYRLSVVTLDVPALRHHPEDVPALAQRYLEEFRIRLNRNVKSFSQEAMQALVGYAWPGNIRELINVVERSVLLCMGDQIKRADLPRTIVPETAGRDTHEVSSALDTLLDTDWREHSWKGVRNAVLRACEQIYLEAQLEATHGSLEHTARRAGVNPRSLYDMMRRHGLKKESYRTPRPTKPPSQ